MGEYDFEVAGETRDATYGIDYITSHKDYNTKTYENDIAIIKTDR